MPTSEIAHLTVLVVEDVRATRVIVRAILRSFGIADVVEAADGQEALEVLAQHFQRLLAVRGFHHIGDAERRIARTMTRVARTSSTTRTVR